jgi:prolyl oligopeptidase
MSIDYPVAPMADVVEVLHGHRIADPYRCLEDPDDQPVVEWVRAENRLTETYLSGVAARPAIRDRIADLWDYPKRGAPFERGGRWFQMRNSGLQAQSVLYVMDGPDGEGRVLIDPNTLSEDGTVALSGLGLSPDGSRLAWAASSAGSDWLVWHVRSVDSGEDTDDVVEWSKFSGAAWTAEGFYYTAMEPPPEGEELIDAVRQPRIAFTGWARPNRRTGLPSTPRNARDGSPMPRSPRTAVSWSSPSTSGPGPRPTSSSRTSSHRMRV